MDDHFGDLLSNFDLHPSEEETAQPSKRRIWPPRTAKHPKTYSSADCLAAIRGQRLPNRGLDLDVTRCSIVRGIRYHDDFGEELRGVLPMFTRALNARMIMSDMIPDMSDVDEFPYCIWHPDVAQENTYRELAQRYPQMKYLVGRACAVGGYLDLYKELDILPEVHIAEEARENKPTGAAIFELLMSSPCRYEVMNDYTRSINAENPRPLAQLNGDTAVLAFLNTKNMPEKHFNYHGPYFNITEDMGLDEFSTEYYAPGSWSCGYESMELDPLRTALLYNPLPFDLPTIQKDVLILMAAYNGDIDRYSRLRRPRMIKKERNCVVRGIYHNTLFAKWWSLQLEIEAPYRNADSHIRMAIEASFIMNNDISRSIDGKSELPYLIYFPTPASSITYEVLAAYEPRMLVQIARACIVANYESLFDKLDPPPDACLLVEAEICLGHHGNIILFMNCVRIIWLIHSGTQVPGTLI
ncbi:hypothetical protein FH972_023911 [Carpinus fangiana]|uniref:Uncharacterized protein n=1 Tax=Carpinus fangiana TaxID=176857 RepID=A0A5N6KX11_9ROSI|nr:hypothetical protein FH972_023911 [Carpinus fangiana]